MEVAVRESDGFEDLVLAIGGECRDWLKALSGNHRLVQEPMLGKNRAILCEPLFWYESNGQRFACFPKDRPPSQRIMNLLDDEGVMILAPAAKG